MAKKTKVRVVGGVDTHAETHHAAVLHAGTGQLLADQAFPATSAGYGQLLAWMARFGVVDRVGVEGTGSYGAGLARHLRAQQITVVEVDRPDRRARRARGKSDPIDAINAARAVLAGVAVGTPKTRDGVVEATRMLLTTRDSAVRARTAAINALHALVITAPAALRDQLSGLSRAQLVDACARLRPDPERRADPTQAAKTAARRLATRIRHLDDEIRDADTDLDELTARHAPTTRAMFGVGPINAAQLLVTAGDNADRIHSEAALARLTGVAPIPASSGNTSRHRLHRGGDRQANKAIHLAVISRLGRHPATNDYMTRRLTENKTHKDVIRCLKRAVIRELYRALRTDLQHLNNPLPKAA
jgi:transposase